MEPEQSVRYDEKFQTQMIDKQKENYNSLSRHLCHMARQDCGRHALRLAIMMVSISALSSDHLAERLWTETADLLALEEGKPTFSSMARLLIGIPPIRERYPEEDFRIIRIRE